MELGTWRIFLLGLFLIGNHLHGAIYGHDDRRDVGTYPNHSIEKKVSKSVALVVPASRLERVNDSFYRLNFKTLAQEQADLEEPLCLWEPFQRQKASVYSASTGFLVHPEILVTAGHVIGKRETCARAAIVFGFQENGRGDGHIIPASNIYRCQEIIETVLEETPLRDHTVLKLNRPVLDRPVLPIRRTGKISDRVVTAMAGHPTS